MSDVLVNEQQCTGMAESAMYRCYFTPTLREPETGTCESVPPRLYNWLRVLRGAAEGVYNDLGMMRDWSAICRLSQ